MSSIALLIFSPSRTTVQLLASGLIVLTFLNVTFKFWKELRRNGSNSRLYSIIGFDTIFCELLGYIPYVSCGVTGIMQLKYKPFKARNREVLAFLQIYPTIRSCLLVSDPYVVKEIASNRARFPKPFLYKFMEYFGSNILTAEGELWKHQRKLTAPNFSEKNNRLVWEETLRVVQDMFDSWGRETKEIPVNHCLDIILPISLAVISSAGFGRRISWSEENNSPPGHSMSFKNTLHIVSTNMLYVYAFPKLVYSLTEKLRMLYRAKEELIVYMKEMIEQRRENLSEERYDLFNALLRANEFSTEEEGKLSESELLGNIFVFLVAGHENTAHTSCFILGLLAIEQEEQEKLHQHVEFIIGHERDIPHYEQFNTLTYVAAVINETLRLFPPVAAVPKEAAEDTLIPMALPDGKLQSLSIPKKTSIYLDIAALHYNPRYWEEPETFNPSRFLGEYNKDAFIPFAAGARACLGRGFAETKLIATLTMIIKNYKVELKNPDQYAGMSKLQQRDKLLANKSMLTTIPLHVPLVFKKR